MLKSTLKHVLRALKGLRESLRDKREHKRDLEGISLGRRIHALAL